MERERGRDGEKRETERERKGEIIWRRQKSTHSLSPTQLITASMRTQRVNIGFKNFESIIARTLIGSLYSVYYNLE